MVEGVSVSDEQGIILYTNPAEDAMFGYDAGELVGQHVTVQNTYPPEENARIVGEVIEHLKRHGVWSGEFSNRKKDGTPFTTFARITALETGGKTYWVCVQEDITERKQAEAALKESEERFRTLANSAPVLIWMSGREKEGVFFNDGWLTFTGRTLEEELGAGWFEAVHPEDFPALEACSEAFAQRKPFQTQFRLRRADGDYRWMLDTGVPRFGPNGTFAGYIGSCIDITERMQAEETLRQGQERLRLALEAGRMGTWEWRIPTGEVRWSESLERLHGLDPGTFEGTIEAYPHDIHPEDREQVLAAIPRAVADGKDLSHEYRIVRPDGTVRWIQGRGRLHRDERGQPVRMVGICMDITERKRLEDDLRERAEALAEADRHKDEFLAMLAHELRNPLAPIGNAAQLLRLRGRDDPSLRRVTEMMERQVRHMARLVDDLLDVSRIAGGKIALRKERIDLALVTRQALESVSDLIQAREHELSLSLPFSPLWLEADPVRLEQIIQNLVENAAKYTEPGGRIWVDAARKGDEMVLRVRDTGVGIAPDLLPRIFDLFTQADRSLDRSQGGLGLGLTLVRRLVQKHGGTVHAESAGPGKGSEFIVRLPGSPPPLPAATAVTSRAGGSISPRRVLVVDDNADAATSLADLLAVIGHEVRVAHTGPAAIEAAATFRPEVLLLDIGLPGMDGYEVARRVREHSALKETLLVALTGYGQEEDRQRAAEAGFDHHLTKPVAWEELEKALGCLPERQ
jgi:two-component system CheB/CheR fusion protein